MTKIHLPPLPLLGALLVAPGLWACGGDDDDAAGTDADTDADTDSDTDADTDADTDTDTDADTDSDTDTDTDTDTDADTDDYASNFTVYTVDTTLEGPSFASVADVDGDGLDDLVVSAFGPAVSLQMPGTLAVYLNGGDLDSWTRDDVFTASTTLKFPNGTTLADLDEDEDLDIVVAGGFLACAMFSGCGSLSWWENVGDGWTRHDIVPFGSDLFFHHGELADIDDDGIDDLVVVGEARISQILTSHDELEARWYKGTDTADRFETDARVIGEGLGSMPQVFDLDDDGDLDVLSAEFFIDTIFAQASFAWIEQVAAPDAENPAGVWTRHVIADDVGPSIQLALVPDLFGDGVLRAVGSNHTNVSNGEPESGIFVYEIPVDPTDTPWDGTMISEGIVSVQGSQFSPQAAPGIFGWGDIDGDGDLDLAVSGDGDKRAFVLEQTAPGVFATHVLAAPFGQAGGMKITDLDGDGNAEIVATCYEENLVAIFEWSGD
ncbi:MAG TPA: FG-GAP-like repeat-containing protein [Polyangia bacterium]|nr:FG-GAP-like repeat-containing protein [Polyangia bacterium]